MLLTPPVAPPGKVAQVELAAVNGAGLMGGSGALVLREDPTPPLAPAGTYITVPTTKWLAVTGRLPLVVAPACAPVGGPVGKRFEFVPAAPSPSVTGTLSVNRPAMSDGESGIRDWFVRLSDTRPTVVDGAEWVPLTDTARSQITISRVPFERPIWVALAARNYAGAFSTPVTTVAPVRLLDRTVASAPEFCLSGDAGRVAVRLTRKSTDPESGILGYQARLRTQAGGVLRAWPQGASVDLPPGTEPGVMTAIPGIAMPASGQLVLELRAVNGAGIGGDEAASGPLTVDGTAPPTPTITSSILATAKNGTLQLRVGISVSADPESGFGGLEIRVDNDAAVKNGEATPGGTIVPWTAIPAATIGNRIYVIGVGVPSSGSLIVQVRSRNGVGMTSVVTSVTTRRLP